MTFATAKGVHLLPATSEFAYDTTAAVGWQRGSSGLNNATIMNFCSDLAGTGPTDYTNAIDQLQADHPECATVSVVIAWLFNSEDVTQCNVYPTTNFLLGEFALYEGGSWVLNQHWMVSGLTEQHYPGIIPGPTLPNGNFVYGGTPSDPSVVRCIRDLKSRGFRVVFYTFLLGACDGYPWRGRIGLGSETADMSSDATAAVSAFLGSAAPGDFIRDAVNLTVGYSGDLYDWTFRRMILHYANLCVVAGGVDLFLIGSELRGLETIRGPDWTPAGTVDGSGYAVWDYPFVAGLKTLAADVRGVFDGAGLTRDLTGMRNLIVYSADWSSWMGWQHPGENGQWPHLDTLYADPNIDFVSFDNYLPLSDWTTGDGGLDAENWQAPRYSGSWPPPPGSLNGLGLSGVPSIYSPAYIKANIEGGQYFDWFYYSGAAGGHAYGRGFDPKGSALVVSLPDGDRLAQARNPYYPGQEILAPKQLRWWWNNVHRAIYDTGSGWVQQGPQTEWVPQSKSIINLEYGFSSIDKATNQPNVFVDPKSVESSSPFWSIWDPAAGGPLTYWPRRDDTIPAVALQAVYDYWNTDGHNETSSAGLPMLQWTFCCVWNWDARPFPTFPIDSSAWGDTANWQQGDWSNGLRQPLPPAVPSPSPSPGTYPTLSLGSTLGWSVEVRPKFSTDVADHVSGRSTRRLARAYAYYDLDLTYEVLRSDAAHQELQAIAGFFEQMAGAALPFWVTPPGLSAASGQALGTGDGSTAVFPLMRSIGGYSEPVRATSGVSAVYLDGVAQSSGWTASSGYTPAITFALAPGAGVAVTADFGVLWLCRFADDVQDFEEFMTMLWTLKTLRLSTVRP